jgi:hypothetical protein
MDYFPKVPTPLPAAPGAGIDSDSLSKAQKLNLHRSKRRHEKKQEEYAAKMVEYSKQSGAQMRTRENELQCC